jgi:hypothetical protein
MSTGEAKTYLRLLAEAELRRARAFGGPGPHAHRMGLAATTLAAAGVLDPDTAWQVVADFEIAIALRAGNPRGVLAVMHRPSWAGQQTHVHRAICRGAGPHAPAPHAVAQQGTGPVPTASPAEGVPTAIPVRATLPLPPEQEGWYGELRLLCLARTDSQAAITVATRWVGQTRRSATARPQHAPFHPVGAVDDTGAGYEAALWDMGIEDGRDWWDAHLGLTPPLPAGTRWLEIGPGAGGRYVRVDLAAPPAVDRKVSVEPVQPVDVAAWLLDLVGEELLCHSSNSVTSQGLGSRAAHVVEDLVGCGALPADDPSVRRLTALGRLLGLDLAIGPGSTSGRAAGSPLPPAWRSMLIDGGARDGLDGVVPFAVTLPEVDGARLALAGLRSSAADATLHVMASGWEPHGPGWLRHGTTSLGAHPPGPLSWHARDSTGRWHLVSGVNWGSRQGMIQIRLTPPLHPAASWLEVIVTATHSKVRVTVPLDWMTQGAP